MLTREDLDMWLDLLIESRGWRSMGDQSRGMFLDQLNKYNPDPDKFGDYCAQMLDAERCQFNDIIRHFKQQYHERLKQKALPQADIKADFQCDGFVRFVRMGCELRQARQNGESYPCADSPGQTISPDFHKLWQRPLTQADRDYANQRRRDFQDGASVIELGGGHD